MDNVPGTIYVQVDEDWTPESGHHPFHNATFSIERVKESDVLYLRAPDPAELRATLPGSISLPPAPVNNKCVQCATPVTIPAAHHTGEGWALWWRCECKGATIDMGWPFGDGWVGHDTLERAGFEIV